MDSLPSLDGFKVRSVGELGDRHCGKECTEVVYRESGIIQEFLLLIALDAPGGTC